jgi:glycosyltransferase involved in cell wall biosynthesis
MKILLDHPWPFLLAHGGFQIQIEQTQAALRAVGLEVEYVQWWNAAQRGDIIHYFGRPAAEYVELAHQKGFKVVHAELFTGQGSRAPWKRKIQRGLVAAGGKLLPPMTTLRFGWRTFQLVDAHVALTAWEAQTMRDIFGAEEGKIHIVPNGVEDLFFAGAPGPRNPWLVCTATVTERKRVLELAQAAVLAGTPVWIIGRPYAGTDPYARRFSEFAAQHPQLIRYEGSVEDRARLAQIYREARGFVLLSTMESLSLSTLEAAAGGCPLLLSDLPWARCCFGANAAYVPVSSPENTAGHLKKFYDAAPALPAPPRPLTWVEVAQKLKTVYERVLSTSA